MTIDAISIINIMFAAAAVLGGLGSRNVATAAVTGFLVALIHGGMIWLVGAQAGKLDLAERPYLNDAVQYAMNTGYLTFPNARYVTYLVVCGIALIAATLVCYLVRWILCSIVCSVMPKRAAT
jgi:hypothetical protein